MFRTTLIFFIVMVSISLFAQTAVPPASGSGTEEDPYQIETLENLYWISANNNEWDKHYIQIADIDATDTENWFDGQGWLPIGVNFGNSFSGSYDGSDNTISNLYINRPQLENVGLFGFLYTATIKNLSLSEVNIIGDSYVGSLAGISSFSSLLNNSSSGDIVVMDNIAGGLVGQSESSIIDYCNAVVNVDGANIIGGLVGYQRFSSIVRNSYSFSNVAGESNAGGLVGIVFGNSSISNSYSSGTVTSYEYHNTGGLVGLNDSSTITDCYSSADVSGVDYVGGLVGSNEISSTISGSYSTGSVDGNDNVGGLIGYNLTSDISESFSTSAVTGVNFVGGLVGYNIYISEITTSYSSGDISGYNNTGGLVGRNHASPIENCYSRGNVTRVIDSSETNFGGFIGSNSNVISYSYSTGDVIYEGTEDPEEKGFVGYDNGGSYTSNFFDAEASNQNTAIGATGLTTAEMQDQTTFTQAGWDFDEIWTIDEVINDGYPYFQWQIIFIPPTNLYVDAQTGLFSWQEPEYLYGELLEYDVYLNGDYMATTEETEYQYQNLVSGENYTAGVVAVYDIGVSEMVTIDFIYDGTDTDETEIAFISNLHNYPNPFNPETTISFSLQQSESVSVEVFNIRGQKVKTLVDEEMLSGEHKVVWNGRDDDGRQMSSGIYLYKLVTENEVVTRKMMLLK